MLVNALLLKMSPPMVQWCSDRSKSAFSRGAFGAWGLVPSLGWSKLQSKNILQSQRRDAKRASVFPSFQEMNKLVCLALVGLVAAHLVAASTTADRLRAKVSQSGSSSLSSSMVVPVSSSSLSMSASMPMSSSSLSASLGSLSGSSFGSSSSGAIPATSLQSGSSCEPSCNSQTVVGNEPLNVEDALRPIDDWLKDFKKRTMGAEGAGDLYAAAKGTLFHS